METVLIIVCLVGLVVLLVWVFCLYLENRKINRTLKYVEEQLSKKPSEYLFDYERSQRRYIEEEIEAIKNYFGVKSVQQEPKVIIVKDDE
jgi:ribosomal protein S2